MDPSGLPMSEVMEAKVRFMFLTQPMLDKIGLKKRLLMLIMINIILRLPLRLLVKLEKIAYIWFGLLMVVELILVIEIFNIGKEPQLGETKKQ